MKALHRRWIVFAIWWLICMVGYFYLTYAGFDETIPRWLLTKLIAINMITTTCSGVFLFGLYWIDKNMSMDEEKDNDESNAA